MFEFVVEVNGKRGNVRCNLPLPKNEDVMVIFDDMKFDFFPIRDIRVKAGRSLGKEI